MFQRLAKILTHLIPYFIRYRLFMSPKEFLAALQQRFEIPEEDGELDTLDLSDSQQQVYIYI